MRGFVALLLFASAGCHLAAAYVLWAHLSSYPAIAVGVCWYANALGMFASCFAGRLWPRNQ